MFKKTLLATAVVASTSSYSVVSSADSTAPIVEENILVTATRTAQSADEALASVDVITADEIARMNPSDGLDLLSQTAGVDVSRKGGRGAAAGLYLRGTSSDHTLVLVDGVRQGSATLGEAGLQFIDPNQIERVEVVRGPRSSLYGSDALGGVIQIFTRKNNSDFVPIISAGFGSNNTKESSISFGGELGSTYVRFGANHYETEGIDNHVNTAFGEDDDDASRMTTLSAAIKHTFANDSKLSLDYFRSSGESEYDTGFWAFQDTAPYLENLVETVNASYEAALTESWSTRVTLGQSKDKSDTRNDLQSLIHDYFYTERQQVTLQNDMQFGSGLLLTAGAEYLDDKVKSSMDYTDSGRPVGSRYNQALFTQLQGDIADGVDFVAAIRRDKNEHFGVETTYNAAVGFELDEQHRLIVSHGTAFKAPTFNDLYWPVSIYAFGNPDVQPETSSNVEVELRGSYDDLSWSIAAFKNDIKDLIDWAPSDPNDPWSAITPSNINEAEILGCEVSVKTDVLGWALSSSLTYLEPRNETNDQILIRRAKSTLALQLGRSFGPINLNLDWKAQSHRYDDPSNTLRLAGYGIVGVNLGYRISEDLSVQLDLDNLFDKDYQLAAGYNTEGFQSKLSATYAF
ncbi:MAG: TonB-dependent receptor [Cellvibrionaceae bacterium]